MTINSHETVNNYRALAINFGETSNHFYEVLNIYYAKSINLLRAVNYPHASITYCVKTDFNMKLTFNNRREYIILCMNQSIRLLKYEIIDLKFELIGLYFELRYLKFGFIESQIIIACSKYLNRGFEANFNNVWLYIE